MPDKPLSERMREGYIGVTVAGYTERKGPLAESFADRVKELEQALAREREINTTWRETDAGLRDTIASLEQALAAAQASNERLAAKIATAQECSCDIYSEYDTHAHDPECSTCHGSGVSLSDERAAALLKDATAWQSLVQRWQSGENVLVEDAAPHNVVCTPESNYQTLMAERDQAIRERDEARANVHKLTKDFEREFDRALAVEAQRDALEKALLPAKETCEALLKYDPMVVPHVAKLNREGDMGCICLACIKAREALRALEGARQMSQSANAGKSQTVSTTEESANQKESKQLSKGKLND